MKVKIKKDLYQEFTNQVIEQMENNLDNIFQNYNNFLYTSEVTVLPLI